jgi:hypothetical protein
MKETNKLLSKKEWKIKYLKRTRNEEKTMQNKTLLIW